MTKYWLLILFLKLVIYGCVTNTTVRGGGTQNCCSPIAGCLKSVEKEPPFLPREIDIDPRITIMVKISLAASLCAWSPNEWHLKSKIAAITKLVVCV
jgi:hypothetical protein